MYVWAHAYMCAMLSAYRASMPTLPTPSWDTWVSSQPLWTEVLMLMRVCLTSWVVNFVLPSPQKGMKLHNNMKKLNGATVILMGECTVLSTSRTFQAMHLPPLPRCAARAPAF